MTQCSVNANQTGFQSLNAATGTWNGRTLTAGTGISITNGSGTGGNPTLSLSPTPTSTAWVPTLQFGGASVGITYSVQQGTYQQIGNLVFFNFRVTLTSKGSSVGTATITGLPVNVGASSVEIIAPAITSSITNTAGFTNCFVDFGLASGTNTVRLTQSGSGQVYAVLTDTNFANSCVFDGCGYYTID